MFRGARSGMEADYLCRALYPTLSALRDVHSAPRRVLSLSRAAIALAMSPPVAATAAAAAAAAPPVGSAGAAVPPATAATAASTARAVDGDSIFVLDTFTALYVLYSALAANQTCPPPHTCTTLMSLP